MLHCTYDTGTAKTACQNEPKSANSVLDLKKNWNDSPNPNTGKGLRCPPRTQKDPHSEIPDN